MSDLAVGAYRADVEAVQVTPSNCKAIADWVNGEPDAYHGGYERWAYPDIGGVELPAGQHLRESGHGMGSYMSTHVRAEWGEWVVRSADGTFSVHGRDAFAATYGPMNNDENAIYVMAKFLKFVREQELFIGYRSNTWPADDAGVVAQFLCDLQCQEVPSDE